MREDIKAQWIAALRSGNYKKGVGALRRDREDGRGSTWCCLGVLCDLVKSDVGMEWNEEGVSWDCRFGDALYGDSAILPQAVVELTGMPNATGTLTGIPNSPGAVVYFGGNNHFTVGLTELNDNNQLTFDQIADVIEYFF